MQSKKYLERGGRLLLEIGYNQGEAVREILTREGYTDILIKKDLSGHDRVVTAIYLDC
jgi:release factor glutamine methyltransferase